MQNNFTKINSKDNLQICKIILQRWFSSPALVEKWGGNLQSRNLGEINAPLSTNETLGVQRKWGKQRIHQIQIERKTTNSNWEKREIPIERKNTNTNREEGPKLEGKKILSFCSQWEKCFLQKVHQQLGWLNIDNAKKAFHN